MAKRRNRRKKKLAHIYREREYLEWRERILSWPAAMDVPNPPLISDLPEAYQEEFVRRMLRRRKARTKPDDFSHRLLEGEE
jgi:hypothetical protein